MTKTKWRISWTRNTDRLPCDSAHPVRCWYFPINRESANMSQYSVYNKSIASDHITQIFNLEFTVLCHFSSQDNAEAGNCVRLSVLRGMSRWLCATKLGGSRCLAIYVWIICYLSDQPNNPPTRWPTFNSAIILPAGSIYRSQLRLFQYLSMWGSRQQMTTY